MPHKLPTYRGKVSLVACLQAPMPSPLWISACPSPPPPHPPYSRPLGARGYVPSDSAGQPKLDGDRDIRAKPPRPVPIAS